MAWLLVSMFACGSLLLLRGYMNLTQDMREPPVIPHALPYIGHLFGLLSHGSKYYSILSTKYNKPVYTLRLPWKKIYVICSPALVAAADRHPKTVSFAPYVVEFAKRILVPSKHGLDALTENIHEENGARSLRTDTIRAMHATLGPGPELERTTQEMLSHASQPLDCKCVTTTDQDVDLFLWTRNLITHASTNAIYGAESNPFKVPAVQAGLWATERDFVYLGLNIFPKMISPKAYQGRSDVFHGFQRYYKEKGYKNASRLVQARYDTNRQYNISEEDIAHFDLSVGIALLSNSGPAAFWTLYHVYSQSSLLEEVRAAMNPYIQVSEANSGRLVRHVNIADAASGCPLLKSIIQETMRVQSSNASGRVVLKDTLLEDTYLLKQGSMVLMPSAVLHENDSIWGSSAKEFDARRFCSEKATGDRKRASNIRSFGGGSALCPGRFFAENEILIILVMMALKFDLQPTGNPTWSLSPSRTHILTSILSPADSLRVRIREREGYESDGWTFEWNEKRTGLGR